MLKLRRLRVERFRSLPKNTELTFSDGINIVLGQNGTGKTTLLELISMVVRSDFSSLAREEFAIEYEFSAPGGESIVTIVRNERAQDSLRTPIELGTREVFQASAEVLGSSDLRRLLQYNAEHGLIIADSTPMGTVGIPSPVEPGFLFFFLAPAQEFTHRYFHPLIQAGNARRFDESLEVFKEITSSEKPLGTAITAKHVWVSNPFSPLLLPEGILQALGKPGQQTKADHSFRHGDLELLATLRDMMGFSAADLRVGVIERREEKAQIGNLFFRFWWDDENFVTHDRLSYGQKRLLTFFYYLACNPDIVISDELVNGLHHRWITAAIEAVGQRQAFLTSQNPLLLDYVPITSAAEVRRSFVLCRGEPRDGRPGWIWENMSQADAEELYRAYQVGVEHVSEILQSRGLW